MIKLTNTETEQLNESQVAKVNRELGKDYIDIGIMSSGKPVGFLAGNKFEVLPARYTASFSMELD